MDKTIFDVDDIRDIRNALANEYAAMPKDAAQALQNERVEEEMLKIAKLRFIIGSVDGCPNYTKALEALYGRAERFAPEQTRELEARRKAAGEA
jgi:hypothetical protein